MKQKEVINAVLRGERPPYVPWALTFTQGAQEKLASHYGNDDLPLSTGSHLLYWGELDGTLLDVGGECVRDRFGVTWDRSVDKDIGVVRGTLLPEPTLHGFQFPDPLDPRCFEGIASNIARYPDKFVGYSIGLSLYERAWTLRGMENLLMDFHLNPGFVRDLLTRIADYDIAQIRKALEYDIDAVFFGDDWGDQRGVQMGPALWREFIKPQLARIYGEVRKAGRWVIIHSCGAVDELFDDLVELGVSCFNPFQPEAMDVYKLLPRYRGRLAFYGGMSTQRTLPFGTVDDVIAETRRLIELGRDGSYIFSPAHAVQGDVPVENILAFIGTLRAQSGFHA